MRPSSLTLFILAPERIALTSRLKGEGRTREKRRVKRGHRRHRTRPRSAAVICEAGMDDAPVGATRQGIMRRLNFTLHDTGKSGWFYVKYRSME